MISTKRKHVYIYSPSSAIRDKSAFKRGVQRLTILGYEVEVDEAALASYERFAGTDEIRIAAIHRACASRADVALISRGGYGLTRILDNINYDAVTQAIVRGTQFVGFSDFTAFQMALLAKTKAISWAGPALGEDFGAVGGADEIMESCFEDMVTGQGEGNGWRLPISSVKKLARDIDPLNINTINSSCNIESAMLWGGNLSMLVSLIGTPYLPIVKDGILFVEDIGEHPYRVERMLAQLLQAGVLAQQKAIIFGQFSQYKLVPHDRGYKMTSVISWLESHINTPIFTGLPFGHVSTKILLPVGMKVTLSVENREAFLLWGHQH